ncbi:hypothetical protein ACSBR1_008314 [Camellia fascicularis]
MASLKCGKVEIIITQLETINNVVIRESRGILYLIRVVECLEQSHELHFEEDANGNKSWENVGSHGRGDQSSVLKQTVNEEDNADKVDRSDDLEVQDEMAKNQWVDMEGLVVTQGGNYNDLTVSVVNEMARELENQSAVASFSCSKSSMPGELLQRHEVGNSRVGGNTGPSRLIRSLSDNGIIRPSINLEVVVNLGPHALVPSLNHVGEGQPNVIIEAHKGPRPQQPIHFGSDK